MMKKSLLTAILMTMIVTGVMAQGNPAPWDGSISGSLKRSDKTIFIDYPAELAALHKLWDNYKDGDRGYVGWTIKLRADLDMNNINFNGHTIGWNDEHKFGGTFDGQGHIIRNLKIEGKNNNRGLFGKIDKGKVMNLKLVNVDIHAGDGDDCHVGAICGQMFNHSTISHCAVVGGSVRQYENGNDEFGAICGYMTNNHNSVEYCYSDITVEADGQVGGLVGKIEKADGSNTSGIYHSYFSGKVIHHGNKFFASIAGERYSQILQNNFYLYRDDGVKGTGWDGGSSDPSGAEIKPCTEEELKQPLLFSIYNDKYTLESDEYVYPFDGYPELKVFLRYDVGDSFYVTNAGHMGENTADSIPGHVRIVKNDKSPFTVTLEKAGAATANTDFVVNETFTPYFNDQQLLKTVGLGANVFQDLGEVNTVTIPAAVDSVATPQRHQVQNAFILNGDASQGAVKDNVLYSLKTKYLLTAPKSLTTMTIHQELADSIADYAFENMTALKTLYVDTYTPAGTLVDDKDNKAPTMKFQGDKNTVFYGCPDDLDVYIKDGTFNQLVYGQLGPKGYGYINADVWYLFVGYYEDEENHIFPYFPISRNEGGMSTMILGYPVELPEGVTAWWATSLSNGNVNLQKLGTQIVPALTPVLLTYEGTEPLYLTRYTGPNPGNVNDYENNLFKGSVDPGGHTMTSSELMSNFFTLGRPAGDDSYNHLGFYQYHPKNNILPAYVAWIANNDIPSEMRLLANFNDDATLINDTTLKPLLNGEKQVYTMQGIRIDPSAMRKGNMYIVNGKLVINR
jgi:hypothetical protein